MFSACAFRLLITCYSWSLVLFLWRHWYGFWWKKILTHCLESIHNQVSSAVLSIPSPVPAFHLTLLQSKLMNLVLFFICYSVHKSVNRTEHDWRMDLLGFRRIARAWVSDGCHRFYQSTVIIYYYITIKSSAPRKLVSCSLAGKTTLTISFVWKGFPY